MAKRKSNVVKSPVTDRTERSKQLNRVGVGERENKTMCSKLFNYYLSFLAYDLQEALDF